MLNMKKNAFTLVELLAVITILGILATITVPIVINVFNSASESAFEDDAMTLSKAADNYYTSLTLESDTKLPLLVTFNSGKETNKYKNNVNNACETSSERLLEYNGQTPDSGNIFIDSNGEVTLAIYDRQSKKCAIKNPGDKTVTFTEKSESECKLTNNPC